MQRLRSDIWASDAMRGLESGEARLFASKTFPGLQLIVRQPKEYDDGNIDSGKRIGWIWAGKYDGLEHALRHNCKPMMAAAGWTKDASEETKARLMTAWTDEVIGGLHDVAFLDEPDKAFELPGAVKFEKAFVLKRRKFDCYWIHRWKSHRWGTKDHFERLRYDDEPNKKNTGLFFFFFFFFFFFCSWGFDGETGDMLGTWYDRSIAFDVNKEGTSVITPAYWSHYEFTEGDKHIPYTGEDSWPNRAHDDPDK